MIKNKIIVLIIALKVSIMRVYYIFNLYLYYTYQRYKIQVVFK